MKTPRVSKNSGLSVLLIAVASSISVQAEAEHYIRPASKVKLLESNFWAPRLEANRRVTVWHDLEQCEETGRIDNFRRAAALEQGYYQGLRFDDSDFYKVIEGASRILSNDPDPKLDQALDELIAIVAKAQQPDGYIYTVMQVPHPPNSPVKGVVPGERWIHEQESHETYCMGHLIEAGVEHYKATGKRSLLDVAIRAADRIAADFGPGNIELPPGHQQIEIALAKLSDVTEEKRYAELARFFLEQRGRISKDRRRNWGEYFQDHLPVTEQSEAVGHAVRAAYQYMAMADVATLTGDQQYPQVLKALWENVATRKLYLTGGIGGGSGEGFSGEYDMPNLRAYNETCSSIANILWQQRMFQLEGDGKYIDILERCLFNSFLSGVSMDGDTFFYPNKLTSVAGDRRSPWFRCACCPPNVLRFIPQIPSLSYAVSDYTIYANIYGSSEADFELGEGIVHLAQKSGYPWNGNAHLTVETGGPMQFTLAMRVPGWLRAPFPSDLYEYADAEQENAQVVIRLNGERISPEITKGFARVTREWTSGDEIEINLPMPVRRVVAHSLVDSCRGRVAVIRGPIVFAAEGPDNRGNVHNLVVPEKTSFHSAFRPELLGGVTTVQGEVEALATDGNGKVIRSQHKLTLIPYYAWAHRGMQPMRVWLAAMDDQAWPTPSEALYAKARLTSSGKNPWTRLEAVNDQFLPTSSNDNETPRFLWDETNGSPVGAGALEGESNNKKLREGVRWIQYDFPEVGTFDHCSVYWATDDRGGWAIPNSFQLLYRDTDGEWQEVVGHPPAPEADRLQRFSFKPIQTSSVRLQVVVKPRKTAGLLEWIVE